MFILSKYFQSFIHNLLLNRYNHIKQSICFIIVKIIYFNHITRFEYLIKLGKQIINICFHHVLYIVYYKSIVMLCLSVLNHFIASVIRISYGFYIFLNTTAFDIIYSNYTINYNKVLKYFSLFWKIERICIKNLLSLSF